VFCAAIRGKKRASAEFLGKLCTIIMIPGDLRGSAASPQVAPFADRVVTAIACATRK
jgi:hypothetical protein